MTPLFKKLNYKQQSEVYILNAPPEFEKEVNEIRPFTVVKTKLSDLVALEFILTFVMTQAEINQLSPLLIEKLKGDAVIWFAYPKGSSKKYKVTINRDNAWQALGRLGMEPVRSVSIDDDWSALRFRKAEFIKKMTRSTEFAMSDLGKLKSKKMNE
jgi:hypothetical protein